MPETISPIMPGRGDASRVDGSGPLLRVDHVQLGYWVEDTFNLAVADATFEVKAREGSS